MPALGRTRTRLLRTVNNEPHATQTDHHDALPTPPATHGTRSSNLQSGTVENEEDIFGDPVSSEDESGCKDFKQLLGIDDAQDEVPERPQFEKHIYRPFRSPEDGRSELEAPTKLQNSENTRSKRYSESDEHDSSGSDGMIFSSQAMSSKRPKTVTGNIHAAVPTGKRRAMYGKSSQRTREAAKHTEFKKPMKSKKWAEQPPPAPKFQVANVVDMFAFGERKKEQTEWQTSGSMDTGARKSLSPSLSSLGSVPDSNEVEEIKPFNLSTALPYCARVNCEICGAGVDKLLKENFEDQMTNGKAMSFKWQQRFCRHHRQETARQAWKEKGYPDIDWTGLERRMRKFDDYLRDVICNRVDSSWKHELRNQLRPSTSSFPGVRKAVGASEVKATTWTGYYGLRGEKAMIEHIVNHLSDDLRNRASKDKAVAASGVKGGVSGFVHGVLVPELACQLIAEDMGIGVREAIRTAALSRDEGLLLNPDVDEDVVGHGKEEDHDNDDDDNDDHDMED